MRSYLDLFPLDIFTCILPYLTSDDLLTLCKASRKSTERFYYDPNGQYWKLIYRRYISDNLPPYDDHDTIFYIFNRVIDDCSLLISRREYNQCLIRMAEYHAEKLFIMLLNERKHDSNIIMLIKSKDTEDFMGNYGFNINNVPIMEFTWRNTLTFLSNTLLTFTQRRQN